MCIEKEIGPFKKILIGLLQTLTSAPLWVYLIFTAYATDFLDRVLWFDYYLNPEQTEIIVEETARSMGRAEIRQLSMYLDSPIFYILVAGWVIVTICLILGLQRSIGTAISNAKIEAAVSAAITKDIKKILSKEEKQGE